MNFDGPPWWQKQGRSTESHPMVESQGASCLYEVICENIKKSIKAHDDDNSTKLIPFFGGDKGCFSLIYKYFLFFLGVIILYLAILLVTFLGW